MNGQGAPESVTFCDVVVTFFKSGTSHKKPSIFGYLENGVTFVTFFCALLCEKGHPLRKGVGVGRTREGTNERHKRHKRHRLMLVSPILVT